MQSLLAYEPLLNDPAAADLLRVKQKEALLLLLKYVPALKDILFDFSEPGKIDLASFMEKNYHFNVQLERFAYLTGRSLSTFKRDFEKIFHQTPGKWLLQRRLKEAYYLIKEKGKAASDVYLDLGFEDLSHFSHTFKREYGTAPSRV
jgi:AraC-like DNA-binding protein